MVCLHDVSSGLDVHVVVCCYSVVCCFSVRSAAFFISVGLHGVSFGLGVPGLVRFVFSSFVVSQLLCILNHYDPVTVLISH